MTAAGDEGRGIGYQPALDGLRAVAVTLVLFFHAGMTWMTGGYLGVSLFFTLSGFLITSLLIGEHSSTGRISASRFYARRMRRLLPASLLCIVGIVVARWLGAFDGVTHLRADVAAAVLQVFNWAKLAGGTSYGDLFLGSTSPLEHYWSLAIEEQFYWLWPLAFLGIVQLVGARRLAAAISALFVGMAVVAVAIAQVWGADAAYWATPARLPEILAGAALAAWVARGARVPSWATWVAVAALALLVVLSVRWPTGSGPAYEGALPLVALVSAALIVGLQVDGPLRRLLSVRPLVAIGRISYGIYLFHWPAFVICRSEGWDLTDPARFLPVSAGVVAAAAVSSRLIEQPIRRSTLPVRPTMVLAACSSITVLALAVVAVAPASTTIAAPPAPAVTLAPVTSLSPVSSRPVRILVVGDSTSASVAAGLSAWAVDEPDQAGVSSRWSPGVGFLTEGSIESGGLRETQAASQRLLDGVPATIGELRPDVVVLMSTITDVTDRTFPDLDDRLSPLDSRYRQRLHDAYRDTTAAMLADGAPHVLWVVPPVPIQVLAAPELNERDRYLVQHEVIAQVVAEAADERVTMVDLDAWLTANDRAGREQRPDGVHLTDAAATQVARDYLGPLIVALVR